MSRIGTTPDNSMINIKLIFFVIQSDGAHSEASLSAGPSPSISSWETPENPLIYIKFPRHMKNNFSRTSSPEAFTLLEVICVMAILSFLTTWALISMNPAKNKANSLNDNLKSMKKGLEEKHL